METITMWAELSANVPNARNMRHSKSTSETVTISPDDAAKIRKDAENAIRADVKLEKSTAAAPFYSNAKKAVLDIKQEKATPQQWVAMLKKNGGLKAGEDAWVGLEAWLNEQRYILWRSYQNLKNPGKYRTIADEARDIAKQGELKVGNYAENVRADVNVAEESDEGMVIGKENSVSLPNNLK